LSPIVNFLWIVETDKWGKIEYTRINTRNSNNWF